MLEYWENISALTRFFYYLAIPATAVLLIQTVLAIVGIGDSDGDVDVDTNVDYDFDTDAEIADVDTVDDLAESASPSGFRMFTVKGIVAFFAIFGWVGIVMSTSGYDTFLTAIVSIIAGIVAMAGVAFIFYSMSKLQYDGTFNYNDAIDHDGKVYIPIPAAGKGVGKIQIGVGERFMELAAMTEEESTIPTGTVVKVTRVEGNLLVVRSV